MGRGANRRVSAPSEDATSKVVDQGSSPGQPAVTDNVDLLDPSAVKRALDDAAASIVLESGMREKVTVSNIKILLGAFTCCWAALAQFFPKKHPYHWQVLLVSLVAYTLCTAVLSLLMWRMEGDAFFFANKGQKGSPILSLSSEMPKYQDRYTLIFKLRNHSLEDGRTIATKEDSVTKWFDSNGHLLRQRFATVVKSALQSYDGAARRLH